MSDNKGTLLTQHLSNDGLEHIASNGIKYRRIAGLENIEPVLRMAHTTHCFKAYEVNPMIGCDHCCVYCSIQAQTPDNSFSTFKVFDDFPTHLEEFISQQADPRDLTFAFTFRADAFSPVMLESGMTKKILSILERHQSRFFVFTKGGHGGGLPADIWSILQRTSNRCQIVMSMGLPNPELEALLEPGAAPSDERLELMRKCHAAGIPTSGSVAPFLPIYEDTRPYAYKVFSRYKDAGVEHVSIELLKVTRVGLERLMKAIPEYAEKMRQVFDWQNKMEVEWKVQGGETVERFFTNKEYLVSQLQMALEVAVELDMSLSVCAEVANLAGMQNINLRAASRGYTCAGVLTRLVQKQKE
jgi:DNA repair photolyase